MDELFSFLVGFCRGRRRKAGLIVLQLSLMTLTLWGVGQSYLIGYQRGHDLFLSSDKGLVWKSIGLVEKFPASNKLGWAGRWHYKGKLVQMFGCVDNDFTAWTWKCCGFRIASEDNQGSNLPVPPFKVSALDIPHWAVALPLSLLAACLLVIRPRSKRVGTRQVRTVW